ncbi:MAG: hypothetical protein K2X87_08725, partial [Gemmataceae bacterium]|nr:hypothetical protein [Gemmataceae bacterium]
PGAYVPPVGGFQPAPAQVPPAGFRAAAQVAPIAAPADAAEFPSALGPNHPLQLRPEHGSYFVLVKSYSRPGRPDPNDPGMTARELAEGLAAAVRKVDATVPIYLYEYVSDEKRADAAAAAAARQRSAAFLASVEEYRKQSKLNDMEFLEPDSRVRYKSFSHKDQIGVFVGGYRTEDEAVRALAVVKRWPTPADNRLLDGAAIVRPVTPAGPDGRTDGRTTIERGFLNPFTQAMVVPNPLSPRPKAQGPAGLDPFMVKLNERNPYSLLKATKTWTLGVKSFSAPIVYSSSDDTAGVMKKPTGKGLGGDVLTAGSGQAEQLAEAIRKMTGPTTEGSRPLNLEAFVLHTRYASLVTVGQFDSPTDPALQETLRILQGLSFQTKDKNMVPVAQGTMSSVFNDKILPVPIPKP